MQNFKALEIAQEEALLLPEREALGIFDFANVVATNQSLALNAGSIFGTANAVANQAIVVTQS